MRSHARPNRFTPRLEALEDRWCPACTINVVGHTMLILGDGAANAVNVTHNGAGNVTATCDSASATGTAINKIVIDTRGGNDTVNLSVTGALTSELHLDLGLGGGNDVAHLKFAAISDELKVRADLGGGDDTIDVNLDQEIQTGAVVDLKVKGQGGADAWTLSVNEVRTNAELKVAFDGEGGNDSLDVFLGDPIDAGAKVKIDAKGGGGNDDLNVDATTFGTGANIAAGATLSVNLDGGGGRDTLAFSHDGDIDGTLHVRLNGGGGGDTATATITPLAGSTGKVNAHVNGGGGRDNLTLQVFGDTTGLAEFDARINGGGGRDTIVSTPNVKVKK